MHCRDESGGEYCVGVDHDQGGVPEINSVWRRSKACGGDQKRVEEIKSVWRRSRECGGDQERVEEIERASRLVGDTERF